jgi:hypothetical protein
MAALAISPLMCGMESDNDKINTLDKKKVVMEDARFVPLHGTGFYPLPVDTIQKILYYIRQGEDIYALGATNKLWAKKLIYNYASLDYLVKNRMTPSYNVEDTLPYIHVNHDFRKTCARKIESDSAAKKQLNDLQSLYEKANSLITLNTCAEKNHGDHCTIPLVTACAQGNTELALFLINNKADVNIVPKNVCPDGSSTLLNETFCSNTANGITAYARFNTLQAIGACDRNQVTSTTLFLLLKLIFASADNSTDYKMLRELIELDAPVNGTAAIDNIMMTPLMFLGRLKEGDIQGKITKLSFRNLITVLLDGGADKTLQDSKQNTTQSYFRKQLSNRYNRPAEGDWSPLQLFDEITKNHEEFLQKRKVN